MSDRAILLFLWFAFFVASLGAIVSYGLRHTSGGIVLLSDEDVVLGLQRIATIYGAYLGVILLAWFTRPVRPIVTLGTREAIVTAVLCTVLFNAMILYFVARGHLQPSVDIAADIHTAQLVALWFSFVVAPTMIYYFGVRPGASGTG